MYIENPKTKGSGIKCCIPQDKPCPVGCKECFFNSGRSYLEPLAENLPNIPSPQDHVIYRINDGNDSSVEIDKVLSVASHYQMKFYNTSFTSKLERFDAPVVLTLNPHKMTDTGWHQIESRKLMFVRFRLNSWNFMPLCTQAIMYYAQREIPIVLTFMNYNEIESIPLNERSKYERKIHVTNEYWMLKEKEKERLFKNCKHSAWGAYVHICEGHCALCGCCLKFYFRKMASEPRELWANSESDNQAIKNSQICPKSEWI